MMKFFRRGRGRRTPGSSMITVAITADTTAFARSQATASAAQARSIAAARAARDRRERAEQVRTAGVWARWYVRGGMDPAYATAHARDVAARELARLGEHDAAAALLQGWAAHRDPGRVLDGPSVLEVAA